MTIESHVIAISGSLRARSYNTALLRHAAAVAPTGMTVELADIGDFPLYNADLRSESGIPDPVAAVRHKVAAADGLLLASPEYNHSMTGPMKNMLDWLSIGPHSPLDRKPTAIMGAGGRLGTAKSQHALRVVLAHNDLQVVQRPEVLVAHASRHFDDDLELTDARIGEQVRRLMFALEGKIRLERGRPRAIVLGPYEEATHPVARTVDECGYAVVEAVDADWVLAELKTGEVALLVVSPQIDSPRPEELAVSEGTAIVYAAPDDDVLGLIDAV